MTSFIQPDFTDAELEVRFDKQEVAIYATPDSMRRLADLLRQLAEDINVGPTAHVHVDDQFKMTDRSLRLVAAVFRKKNETARH